jgi:hypothetical protein
MLKPVNRKKLAIIISFATVFAIFGGIYLLVASVLSQPSNIDTLVLRPKPPNKSYEADPIAGIKKTSLFIPAKDGSKIHAWLFRLPHSTKLTIVSHGNAGNVSNRFYIADALVRAGSSALVYDYRGYGLSTGKPTIPGILEDGLTVYDYGRIYYPANEILLYGESIGTAVTCHIASQRPVAAVILQSGIANLPSVAKHLFLLLNIYPDFVLPEPHLDNAKLISKLNVPLLILHGRKDTLVPVENSEQLFSNAHEPKKLVILDHCGHNDMGVQDTQLFLDSIKE